MVTGESVEPLLENRFVVVDLRESISQFLILTRYCFVETFEVGELQQNLGLVDNSWPAFCCRLHI